MSEPRWHTSSYSGASGSCVEVREHPDRPGKAARFRHMNSDVVNRRHACDRQSHVVERVHREALTPAPSRRLLKAVEQGAPR